MGFIFENRRIERSDLKSLKLPDSCRNLSSGQTLDVKDDQGNTHELKVENRSGKICFTGGWEKFINEKCIEIGDEISLSKVDGNFGSVAQWRIKVKKANKKRDR